MIYKKVEGLEELSSDGVVKKISAILGHNGFFLAKDKSTGRLSIVGVQDGFKKWHANCEFIIRDNFFDLGVINYGYWNYVIDKYYKRNFLEIVLEYANGYFENWKDFSNALRNFIREVLNKNMLKAQYNKTEYLEEIKKFSGKDDKFSFSLACDCEWFSKSGSKLIFDIKKFLTETEVDRYKSVEEGGQYCGSHYLVMYIVDPKKVEFYSSDQDYALKPVNQNIQICNFFEYNEKLNSAGIKKLLKGNDYDIFQQDAELSFGGYLDKINVKTTNLEYVNKRHKGKLKFVISNPNILQFVKDEKMLEDKEYYLDEIDNILRPFGNSIVYDKSKFKDKGTFEIKIVKPINNKVEYVKKNVKFGLYWNLKEIYGLKTDEKTVKKEFQIDATSTLKSVLDVFFKQLNGLVKNAENIRPESYDVFASDGKKIDPAKYEEHKILKDEEFTIKLDIFDEKYFKKKDCTRNLEIRIKDYIKVQGGIKYIYVPKFVKFETLFLDGKYSRELLEEMLKEELQKKVFKNSKDIEFEDFFDLGNAVELSIKNLAEGDIKEIKFVTSIKLEAPKYFKEKEHISYLECEINKDSKLGGAIKNIVEEIKKGLKKELKILKDPVFESIKYGEGKFFLINNASKITPCKEITLMFKSGENINEDYIYEDFPVEKYVDICLNQDNDYFVLKEEVENIIKKNFSVKLHEDATCKDFLEKVAQVLQDKTKFKNPPALSFKNKINVASLVSSIYGANNLYLYLDPSKSREYVEINKGFEGVLLFFNLKCGINNYKLKKGYKDECYLGIKNIVNDKTTIEGLKEALEEQLEIGPKQCRIYGKENKEFKANDIIADKEEVVVEITDPSLDKYLIPSKEMTFTIEYEYSKDAYKLKDNAPNKVTALIAEEDLNKNIENFIKDHIIETIKSQNKGISNIYPYSLNNVKWNSNEEVKGFINGNEEDIVVLELFEGCNLLESKEKNKKEELNKEKNKEEKPKEKPKEKLKEKKEEIKEEKPVEKLEEHKTEEIKEEELKKDKTKENKNIENKTKEKKSKQKSKEKAVGESGKKSGKTTLKSGDVKNSTGDKKGGCCKTSCKSGNGKSTEKKNEGCCCGRSRL